jgi:hypothetical protein
MDNNTISGKADGNVPLTLAKSGGIEFVTVWQAYIALYLSGIRSTATKVKLLSAKAVNPSSEASISSQQQNKQQQKESISISKQISKLILSDAKAVDDSLTATKQKIFDLCTFRSAISLRIALHCASLH